MSSVLEKLNINSMEHLCLLLGTNLDEINDIIADPNRHYRRWPHRNASGKTREICAPKARLKQIQRRLTSLLQRISMPNSILGGRPGRSTYDNARLHQRKACLLKTDLTSFFDSVDHKRVYGIFQERLGCKPDIARILTKLTTTDGHLPTGAPTSTPLANLAAEPIVNRLEKLAKQHGASFSTWVDDFTLSGPNHLSRLQRLVINIIRQEGFEPNVPKTGVFGELEPHVTTGMRVDKGLDIPPEKLELIQESMADIRKRLNDGKHVRLDEITKLQHKMPYLKRLNPGTATMLERRLRKLEKELDRRLHLSHSPRSSSK